MTQLASRLSYPFPDRRASARTHVGQRSVLRREGQAPSPVQLVNVAREGCALSVEVELEPHQQVEIDLAGLGPVSGRIVWRSASAYGCRFENPLPAGAITRLLLAEDDGAEVSTTPPPSFLRGRISPVATLALLAGVSVFAWAGVAEIVLQLA
ncbi:hypothetical protein [Sphingomonas sp. PB1R3]|uniref:hypothetical protein n=1 Tax=Sphingomonas flavida TaxID=3096154 RepID=UPI002FC823A5